MARVQAGAVQVEGLKEFSKAMKAMGPEFSKDLRQTNKSVATTEAAHARAAAFAQGSTLAHVAPSIKFAAGANFAGVAGGGPAYPAFGGAEFGSNRFKQFQPWRGSGPDAGYAVFPTIRKDAPRINRDYEEAFDAFLERNGLA